MNNNLQVTLERNGKRAVGGLSQRRKAMTNNMTATEMMPAVGETVKVRFEDLQITCKVVDVKMSWGRPRLQIEPLAGEGRQWVELGRVTELVRQAPDWARTNGLIGEGK